VVDYIVAETAAGLTIEAASAVAPQ